MVKIRLTRTGHKNHTTFRIVVIDSNKKRDGKAIEYVGYYLPHSKSLEFKIERIKYWLSVGAQPSATVARLLVKSDLMQESELTKKTFSGKPGRKVTNRNAAKADKAAKAEADRIAAEEAAKAAAEAAAQEAEAPAEEVVAETATEEQSTAEAETTAEESAS